VHSEPLTVKRNPDGRLPERLTVAALIERLDYHHAQRASR
jgi:hypothetical protein